MILHIHIEDLIFETIIGVLPHERITPQKVIINTTIEYDYQGSYIDYALIAQSIENHLVEQQYLTIEEAVIKLIKNLKMSFELISSIKLKLQKPQIMDNCKPSVEIFQKY